MEYLKDARNDDRLSSCGDFESAKAMAEQGVGYAMLPDRVARPSVEAGRIESVPSAKKLQQIGSHWVVFSCRKHRASDQAITWVLEQLVSMLKTHWTA